MRRRDLRGGSVIVIGAARGIGAATAEMLVAAGARVLVADVDTSALSRLHDRLATAGRTVGSATVDVADPESVSRLAKHARTTICPVAAVVNCAGLISPGPFERASLEEVRKQVEVNFLGSVHVAQAFVPMFRESGAGHVVLVASLGGIVPMPFSAVYSAAKFAVRGLGLALSLELRGTGVSVSVICPDSTDTVQLRIEAMDDGSPLSFASEPLRPEAVARAIVRTLRKPRSEVVVPPLRGRVVRALGASPPFFGFLYRALRWQGERRRRSYLSRRGVPSRARADRRTS